MQDLVLVGTHRMSMRGLWLLDQAQVIVPPLPAAVQLLGLPDILRDRSL